MEKIPGTIDLDKIMPIFMVACMALALIVGDINKEYYLLDGKLVVVSMSLLYVFSYLYLVTRSRVQFSFNMVVMLFIAMKCYLLLAGVFGGEFLSVGPTGTSDWERFHVPQALKIDSYTEHLFSPHGTYNGRLTHVLIALYVEFIKLIGAKVTYSNILLVAYMVNFLICLAVLRIVYVASYNYSGSILYANRAVWFLAFNPFFILSTSAPLKESLLFLALAIFLHFFLAKKKNIALFILSVGIIAFERIYLMPLLIAIYIMMEKGLLKNVCLMIVGLVVVELFIGIDRALSMHRTHVESLTSIDGSYLSGHGIISNTLRTLFGPAFFRPLVSEYTDQSVLNISKYLLYLFYAFIALKSFFNFKGPEKIIILTYLFVLIFVPFHGTLKVMLLTIFATVFLDKVSFVKYIEYKKTDNKIA